MSYVNKMQIVLMTRPTATKVATSNPERAHSSSCRFEFGALGQSPPYITLYVVKLLIVIGCLIRRIELTVERDTNFVPNPNWSKLVRLIFSSKKILRLIFLWQVVFHVTSEKGGFEKQVLGKILRMSTFIFVECLREALQNLRR